MGANARTACLLTLGLFSFFSQSLTSQTVTAVDYKSELELNEPNFDTRKIFFYSYISKIFYILKCVVLKEYPK